MEKLNLPIIKGELPPGKCLNMDNYARFVQLYIKYVLDKKAYQKWKRESAVNVPFSL